MNCNCRTSTTTDVARTCHCTTTGMNHVQQRVQNLHSFLPCLNHPAPVIATTTGENHVQERMRNLHSFLHCLDDPLSCIETGKTTLSKNACGNFTIFCTVLCGPSPAPVNAQQWARKQRPQHNPHLQRQQMRPNPAQGHHQQKKMSTICSTVRSGMRSKEEDVAVVLCPGREP